jgi:hypothetical protein
MTMRIVRSALALAALSMLALSGGAGAQPKNDSAASLSGDWQGELKTPFSSTSLGFRFTGAAGGDIVGYIFDLKNGTRARMNDVRLVNGKLTFEQPVMQAKFEGTISGATLHGAWTQPPLGREPLEMSHGPFTAPVTALAISAKDMEKIHGIWTAPSGDTKGVSLQFDTTADGKRVGYLDLPAFRMAGVPVTEAVLTGGQLLVKMGSIQSEYHAQLSSGQLQGEWQHPGGAFQLLMVRQ